MREPVLDQRVNVERLWSAACEAARHGEKWGQRKKAVADAMRAFYAGLRRDRRGADEWVERVVGVLGHFTPATDWRTISAALAELADADVDTAVQRLRSDGTLPADGSKNTLFKVGRRQLAPLPDESGSRNGTAPPLPDPAALRMPT